MRAARTRFATAMLALAVMASPAALAQMPPPTETTPVPKISLPPVEATATPLPGTLLKTQGQLLDIQDGFVFFTSGDGFKLAPDAKIVTLETGAPVAPATIPVRAFAAATFNSQTGQVVQLAISKTKLKTDQTYVDFENVRRYAIVTSTPAPNPELAPKKGVTGKLVAVTFVVRVPATTGLTDLVYITTDQSGWNPQAIRLDRDRRAALSRHLDDPLGNRLSIQVHPRHVDDARDRRERDPRTTASFPRRRSRRAARS